MHGTSPALPHLDHVTHRWVDVNGLHMHIAEAGSGDPLLLLHGFPQHWWQWRGVIPRLAEHYRVIAVDQRGFGWTDAPAHGYTASKLVEDVVQLMAALGIPRARFLTHDWGAIVGQLIAMERPDLVEALVVTGAPDVHIRPTARIVGLIPKLWHAFVLALPVIGRRLQRNRRFMRHLFTAFEPEGGVSEEDIRLYQSRMEQPERTRAGSALYRGTILPAFIAIMSGAYAKRSFTVPTLVLIGAMEPSRDLQEMGHRPGLGGNVTAEIIPGEGHFLIDHQPDLIADRALGFFAQN